MGRSGRYVEMRVEPTKRRRKRQVTVPKRPCGCSADLTGVLLQAIAAVCVRCGRGPDVWVATADESAVMLVPACGAHELDAVAGAAALGDAGTDTYTIRGLDQVRRFVAAFHGERGCRTRRLAIGGSNRGRRAG